MNIKYAFGIKIFTIIILSCIIQLLFFNINSNFVYGKTMQGNKNRNFNMLLKKYGINLKKPQVIPMNKISSGYNYQNRSGNRLHKANIKRTVMPVFLKQRVSLSGDGNVKSALMLLSREIGIPIIFYRGFPNKLKNEVYYKNIRLYKVLNGLITDSGFKYVYKNGEIIVYVVEEKTFHIPVSDLLSSFSSTVGMMGMNIQNNNPNSMAATGSGDDSNIKGGDSTAGSVKTPSNPSGSLSLSLSESDSLYNIISNNIKVMLAKEGRYFINRKDGVIWVKGRVSNVEEVSRYIKNIDKFFSKQVFLKVEVIDVNLNRGFQTGVNWNLLFNKVFKANTLGMSAVFISARLASGNGINDNAPYIGFTGSGNSAAILSALKMQGSVNVISQPRLVLMDGQTRLISSGTITPYVSSVQTMALSLSQTETYPVISQVQTGLSISFTPHINFKDDSVSVTLSLIDNSITGYRSFSINGSSFSNPIIESKSFADTVNVKSGSTILVGGILTTDKTENSYGIPLLSKIPLIGNLFKSINNRSRKEDLLIMLTPKIIS
ncbi:type II secretion system protein GspD [Candidatus Acidulodesulfobacterium sp. H_13]|uniref:type II secretion system protein GspD n=1 Tax=Candidatus Acidulodesulfobacterium sp. H_13 TaxID=3395470 RepID=UPI003AF66A48